MGMTIEEIKAKLDKSNLDSDTLVELTRYLERCQELEQMKTGELVETGEPAETFDPDAWIDTHGEDIVIEVPTDQGSGGL